MLTVPPTRPACQGSPGFQLRFASLHRAGQSLSFPCDACGQVALDSLSERSRNNYFFARAVVGRDFAWPVVEPMAAPALH